MRRRVDRLARRLGVRRPVRIIESAGLTAPVAFGTLWPTIGLPTGFADDFDPRGQEVQRRWLDPGFDLGYGDP